MTDVDELLKKAGFEALDVKALEAHVKNGGLLKTPCMSCAVKLIKIQGLFSEIVKHIEEKAKLQ